MTDVQDKNERSFPPWVPMAKDAAKLLPIDQPFTEVEALFSLQLDHNNGNSVTVLGYAKRWGWTRDRVRTFLGKCGLGIKYPHNTRQIQKQVGQLTTPTDPSTETPQIMFIDFNMLKSESHRKPTDDSTLLTRTKRKRKEKDGKDPRVSVFSAWFSEKFKKRFQREYQVSNWEKHGAQIKKLLSMALSWEDLQYVTIEFLFDQDPFLKEKGGHNIGTLLTRIGQNVYSLYQDPGFRANNANHIIGEPASKNLQGKIGNLFESQ
jgi:hypothetical protein